MKRIRYSTKLLHRIFEEPSSISCFMAKLNEYISRRVGEYGKRKKQRVALSQRQDALLKTARARTKRAAFLTPGGRKTPFQSLIHGSREQVEPGGVPSPRRSPASAGIARLMSVPFFGTRSHALSAHRAR